MNKEEFLKMTHAVLFSGGGSKHLPPKKTFRAVQEIVLKNDGEQLALELASFIRAEIGKIRTDLQGRKRRGMTFIEEIIHLNAYFTGLSNALTILHIIVLEAKKSLYNYKAPSSLTKLGEDIECLQKVFVASKGLKNALEGMKDRFRGV